MDSLDLAYEMLKKLPGKVDEHAIDLMHSYEVSCMSETRKNISQCYLQMLSTIGLLYGPYHEARSNVCCSCWLRTIAHLWMRFTRCKEVGLWILLSLCS
jgi:hypothetical protein